MYSLMDFQGKHPGDLFNFFHTTGLKDSMPNLYALTCLVLTIPVYVSSVERYFSTVTRINSYSRNTTGQDRMSSLVIISIESELLQLKLKDKFHCDVVDHCEERTQDDFV
ncbi:hypothetical protein EOD39_6398 [Acipenser ruthenus]|uniref:HAT C-terminal dimerisation domain-containing protein n=1 Tax=Acipenser ruthenus TaxID=7906 RepID=A0A662YY61_ACIRT|nr:hypothetical protein EOD39_6398 [Acipenser ruthenus]